MEALIRNLTYRLLLTIIFFGWPVAAAVVVRVWGRQELNSPFSFWGALYYSLATYFGIGAQEPYPERFKWPKLIHRIVGTFAWAYITAVFIITIIS
ncbi:MAG: hypothetical protein A2Z25_10155 [Planctomycetes bacterium RBG_16_55_9]|nr:MAG: hypothetical protein A2Z25_10155 [Planctomycetes bacterium RBG_16_55_9]